MKTLYLPLVLIILTLIGCGGSGSSSGETQAIPAYVPDGSCDISKIENTFKLTAPSKDAVLFQERKLVVSLDGNITNISTDLVKVEYWADDKTIILGSSNMPTFSTNYNTKLLTNGHHTVQAYAYDSCGGVVTSQVNPVLSYAYSFKDAKEFHVAVDGTPEGDGSINNPWDVTTAFGNYIAGVVYPNPDVKPGDIIWMHGGNYDTAAETSAYKTFLVGTQEKPIIVRAYGDGPVDIHIGTSSTDFVSSAYNWFWGLEPNTKNANRNNVQGSYERIPGFSLDMPGHSVINCVLSDMGHPAIGAWGDMADGEIYGTVIWGTGHYEEGTTTPIRGSAIYTQNDTNLTRKIRDVISFRNFNNGVKPYTESGKVDNYHIEGTIGFKNHANPIIVSSGSAFPAQNLKVINNFTYEEEDHSNSVVSLGNAFVDTINNGLLIEGNYFVSTGTGGGGPLIVSQWDNLSVQNNTIVTRYTTNISETPRLFSFMHSDNDIGFSWDNNTYFGGRDESIGTDNLINIFYDFTLTYTIDQVLYSLIGWQDYITADLNSTWTRNYPTENVIFVRPNLYERGRGHIVIYNWEGLDDVWVDISDLGLDQGEEFEVRDAENFYGPAVWEGFYSHTDSKIPLPMNLTAVAPIVGNITHMDNDLSHTSNRFSTFVVLKK